MAPLNQITHQELKEKLRKGTTKFYFRKVNGDLRIALGTLKLSNIPANGQPKGGKGPARCTAYYDLEKSFWRTVSESQKIWID